MKKILLVGVIAALLAGCVSEEQRLAQCEAKGVSRDACYIADQNRQATINAAAEKQALENAHEAVQHGQAAHVADPLREASFSANGIKASINNGFTQATINGKKAVVKHSNANFYEVKGAGYVLSISLDANGVTDASWNKTHGRDHGILNVVQK
ncbi:membrane lipoprotein lipid attachment site-containing protein [Leclercia adecarboxylata]|uniref:membrane lipoprotein lipid attachment site-containing protein n=1 Tax=Leclercia adecarboxylata TaxID=83655 RepID=UPI00057B4455|nr:membrane lipoprotein lipid attachment site-containing protein [Leclercia adecarboxylata]